MMAWVMGSAQVPRWPVEGPTRQRSPLDNARGRPGCMVYSSRSSVARRTRRSSVARRTRIVESDEDVLIYEVGHIPGRVKIDCRTDLNEPRVGRLQALRNSECVDDCVKCAAVQQ